MDEPPKAKPLKKNKRKRSEGEERVHKLLIGLDVLAKDEEWWPQCKDKGVLRFDFFVISRGGRAGLIEVDGRQHFEVVLDLRVDEIELANIKRRDTIKNRFARERGLSILRVAYTELNHVEKWVSDYIRDLEFSKEPIHRFSSPLLYINPFGDDVNSGCVIC
jgi:hypothetical protein